MLHRTTVTCNLADDLFERMKRVIEALNEENGPKKVTNHSFVISALECYVEAWEETIQSKDVL